MPVVSSDELLTPQEVADLFRVSLATLSRWSHAGKIPVVRTPTGRFRYRRAEIEELLNDASQ